jgi:hypothetical protein
MGSIGVDMLMSKAAWVVGAIARRSPAVERGRVFQFVESQKSLPVLIRLGNEVEVAKGNEVSRRALLVSAVVKFRSWSQLSGGCPWWLAGCSELSWREP